MAGYLTTHILDTMHGCPAAGVTIRLYRYEQGEKTPLGSAITNADGRTDVPMLREEAFEVGVYQFEFNIGDYFRSRGVKSEGPSFLEVVPVRFGIDDVEAHYHVPLLTSPFSYSTYRGS